jgi:phasin family protein
MAQPIDSYVDMFRKFGSDLGMPKFDIDAVIDGQRKNLEALVESAKVAAGSAQSIAHKQREIVEAALHEAATLAQGFQPFGDPKVALERQTEFAKKTFEIAAEGAKEAVQAGRQSTTEALKIIQERLKEGLSEYRGKTH